jgi:hypothetical protein
MHFLSLQFLLHVASHPILLDLITVNIQYLVNSKNHEASHYVVFCAAISYFLILMSKYSLRHLVLSHPQLIFGTQGKNP